jgi:hypothetical protein
LKKEEAIAYAEKLLRDSGASDEEVTLSRKLFEREQFFNGFVPRPEVDRSLDSERAQRRVAQERNDYLEKDWYPKAEAAYKENLAAASRLKAYEETYGRINTNGSGSGNGNGSGSMMTPEEQKKLIQEELRQSMGAFGATTMDFLDAQDDYRERFNKRFPRKEFEKFVEQQQKDGQFQGVRTAYTEFVRGDIEKDEAVKREARDKQIRDEAIRDYRARNHMPDDSTPKETSIVFRKADDDKGDNMTAREAFQDALDHPEEAAKKL